MDDQNVGLAAVAKRVENMSNGQKVTLFVNEEAVAEKRVVVTASGGRLIELVDDGTDGGSVISGELLLGRSADGHGAEEAHEKAGNEKQDGVLWMVLGHEKLGSFRNGSRSI